MLLEEQEVRVRGSGPGSLGQYCRHRLLLAGVLGRLLDFSNL